MELYDIQIDGSTAAYLHMGVDGDVFYDVDGNVVDAPEEPIHYVYRSGCTNPPAWA